MIQEKISKYTYHFKKLRRDYRNGGAPHKPILLLSIIQLIKREDIFNNRILISPELVMAFKENWSRLVETKHNPNFALPFFHMQSEPFWRLVAKPGMEIAVTKSNSIRSFKNLRETVAFAEMDKDLFLLMLDPVTRTLLEDYLVDTYFENTKSKYIDGSKKYQLELKLESEIVNDDRVIYRAKIEELKNKLSDVQYQEEIFIRNGAFKREIPKIYNYQCCISRMKVESTTNAQMVDACHIIPFSESHDDTLPNGISLSPNLHRAFDRGLLTINKDFLVRVSPSLVEMDSPYSISQFEGCKILLPENDKHYPSMENIEWHRKERFVI